MVNCLLSLLKKSMLLVGNFWICNLKNIRFKINMENQITAIVLAGGKSQRMGTDKGLLDLHGKTFVQRICAAVQPIVGSNILIVSANNEYDALGFSRVEDIIENKGPVGGLYTG